MVIEGGEIMPIRISPDQYPGISEIWGCGPNTIIVNTIEGRSIKVTAQHNIRSGATPNYFADYEEKKQFQIGEETYDIWVDANYPWQDGNTAEECLLLAIRWVVNPH
jgi:hypothetical protein